VGTYKATPEIGNDVLQIDNARAGEPWRRYLAPAGSHTFPYFIGSCVQKRGLSGRRHSDQLNVKPSRSANLGSNDKVLQRHGLSAVVEPGRGEERSITAAIAQSMKGNHDRSR
jgi:hypothetical protein